MKKLLVLLTILVVVAAVALAGSPLAPGNYSIGGIGAEPIDMTAGEAEEPFTQPIWLEGITKFWNEESGRYEVSDGAGGTISWEFLPPDVAKKTHQPGVGPPFTQTGNYTSTP